MRVIFIPGGRVATRLLCEPQAHCIDGTDALIEAGEVINVSPGYAEELIAAGIAERIHAPSKKMISVSLKMEGNSNV